ncbi:XRN 5'-3' exonuclease N-terminus-domain-containing protein [Sporodiniella umbellata]|nr:XRN 5'-3' exonuclease N-terminus-domain-containing protein [Sporodiniella umbellata]
MGVPAFFRWLSDKFPKVVTPAIEEHARTVNGVIIPVDTTKPNPNNEEFDNLYLDMNGIIHPCCHPENKPAPATEDDMMIEIFAYLDRVVNIVRPRKVLYMAIDGVAPRAKMNQQRSRRFRASQLAQIEKDASERVAYELAAIGQEHLLKKKEEHFDSNCITPGTPFMAHLATCLRYHIAFKQNTDPLWKNLKVILSDATVPGEGEHKVMEFIRVERSRPEHNPNTSHVMYGLDADLIMLALGTHEPHFKIIREDVFADNRKTSNCTNCKRRGHTADKCPLLDNESERKEDTSSLKPYVFLHVNILREYIDHALRFNIPGIKWDLERAIDDWVFMCFFVGNDFLPHLPSLEIREGAISTLSLLWKKVMPEMGGYMTKNGDVDLERVQYLVSELGYSEDTIFRDRKAADERRAQGAKRRKLESERRAMEAKSRQDDSFALMTAAPVNGPHEGMSNQDVVTHRADLRMANLSAAAALKAQMAEPETPMAQKGVKRTAEEIEEGDDESEEKKTEEPLEPMDTTALPVDPEEAGKAILKRVADEKERKEQETKDKEPGDEVRLWETGWKERYYQTKFRLNLEEKDEIRDVVRSYCEGLVWVFKYYYIGCVSWSWYYPYYYAPMASDFTNIATFDIQFEQSAPLKPFEQLMGVLPAASRSHLPEAFHPLMMDENSPILDFYPTQFEVDMDGKKWEWQGVVKLPFIDSQRLLNAMNTVYDRLSEEEVHRNSIGPSVLYVSEAHKAYNHLSIVYTKRTNEVAHLDAKLTDGLTGEIDKDPECIPNSTFYSPLPNHDLPDINNDKSISVTYALPKTQEGFVFSTQLLRGLKISSVLGYEDLTFATFEKIDHRHKYNQNRGWTSQMNHMEEYREHQNQRYNHHRGGHPGYDYQDRGYHHDRRGGGYQNRNHRGRGGGGYHRGGYNHRGGGGGGGGYGGGGYGGGNYGHHYG